MSATSVASESATETMTAAEIISIAKTLTATDLFKLLKAFTAEAEKRSKSDSKATASKRVKKEKKEKGAVPIQLRKNHAWVGFTLKHAQENGWESFVNHNTRKDKETGEKVEEEIEMSASMLHESAHVYEDSISDKTPAGRQINRSEAMSLAKVRKESNHETWAEFEEQYVPEEGTESSGDTKSTTSSKKSTTSTVVRKTAAEKEKEKEEKKAAKEKEKEEKKAAAEAAKVEKKAAKEKEKEEKKAAKEKETAVKAAPTPVPKKAAGGAGAKAESESEASVAPKPVKTATKVAVKAAAKEEKVPTVEDDGKAHLVNWKGKAYYMMASGEAWEQTKQKSMGKWAGMFDAEKNILDTTVEEPTFEED